MGTEGPAGGEWGEEEDEEEEEEEEDEEDEDEDEDDEDDASAEAFGTGKHGLSPMPETASSPSRGWTPELHPKPLW